MIEPTLNSEDFRAFSQLAYDKAGIMLRPGKESLVAARVGRRVRTLNLPNAAAYRRYLEEDSTGLELVAFLDEISTNVTSFFREAEHFDLIRDHVMELVNAGKKRIRLWSAACSSGEEPYTLAMVLDQALGGTDVDWRVLATDISLTMLERAAKGEYSARDLSGVPEGYHRSAFVRSSGDEEARWVVRDRLRRRLVLRRLNLAVTPYAMRGPMDVILCRNVMIYLADTVRQGIVREAERLLCPGGMFMISHTETLAALETTLHNVRPSVSRKEIR